MRSYHRQTVDAKFDPDERGRAVRVDPRRRLNAEEFDTGARSPCNGGDAGVAELVDALVSKSSRLALYRFESGLRYHDLS